MLDVDGIVKAIRTVVSEPAGHHDAYMGDAERAAVAKCLDNIKDHAPVNDLERAIEKTCKVDHAVATSSGSAALEIALRVAGVEPGDMVLVPSMTFVAAANAVTHVGAVPFFLDSTSYDFGINAHKLERFLERETVRFNSVRLRGSLVHHSSLRPITAIIAVHVLGHPCDILRIRAIANERGIRAVVEDAAEAIGSSFQGRPCGSFGHVSVLSFNLNKTVSGGGGALLTDNPDFARNARALATTWRTDHPWHVAHMGVGWNYRMPTLCAAVVGAQLAHLPHFLKCKRALAQGYQAALKGVDGVTFHVEPDGARSNYWLSTVMVDPRYPNGRDELLAALHNHGLMGRAAFTPMHRLPMYAGHGADNPLGAEDVWNRAVCLPSGVRLGERLL